MPRPLGTRPRDYPREIADTLQLVSASLEGISRELCAIKKKMSVPQDPGGGGNAASLARIEAKLDALKTQGDASTARENRIMAFTEDVLTKIAAQTTRLDSINVALEALVADGTITAENKLAIMAAFGTTDAQLDRSETALGTNVPPIDPDPDA